MPSYFPASAEIGFHEALSPNFVRALCFFLLLLSLLFFAQSRILRDSEIDTKCLFQVRARESNICRKSCNKCMWNVEWHGWVMHIVIVFVPLMSWFCLLLNLELPGFRF